MTFELILSLISLNLKVTGILRENKEILIRELISEKGFRRH